ncbi:hypothetical protein HY495_01710 [Candidatus Woesearchaeota archaeon]|nr:hypothetical protein [Candidatus Woesearchaeota archaeon]
MSDHQGINVDFWAFYPAKAEGEVAYAGGNRLIYTSNPTGGSLFEYYHDKKMLCLNDLVGEEWSLYPAESRFQVQLRREGRVLPKPEIHLATIQIGGVPSILEAEISLLAALHEIGHAIFNETLYDYLVQQDFAFTQKGSHTSYLIETLQHFSKQFAEFPSSQQQAGFNRYDERIAWRFAYAVKREKGILPALDDRAFTDFSQPYLASYGKEYLDVEGDIFPFDFDPFEKMKEKILTVVHQS